MLEQASNAIPVYESAMCVVSLYQGFKNEMTEQRPASYIYLNEMTEASNAASNAMPVYESA